MMDDPALPTFYVSESSGPLSYLQDDGEVEDATLAPFSAPSIPSRRRNPGPSGDTSAADDNAVFSTSSTAPLLRPRSPFYGRIGRRIHSAPTLMEHEVGLALRSISDEFNENYTQHSAERARRASHPASTNHRSDGFINMLRRQFSRRSWTSSHTSSGNASEVEAVHSNHQGSSRLSERVQSVLEEEEGTVQMEPTFD